jgi:uncharacterized membrane protein HdeD (DUF308 family)
MTELASFFIFGPLLLASSLFQFLTALYAEKGKKRLLHIAAAGLEGIFGFWVMAHPRENLAGLLALVAAFLVAGGLARLARSLTMRPHVRAWTIGTGVVALLLGISVWIEWPATSLWIVGLFLGVDFVCHGISWSIIALAERNMATATGNQANTCGTNAKARNGTGQLGL